MKESRRRVSIGREVGPVLFRASICCRPLGLGQEIRTVEVCGSDEWQISLHEV